MGHEHPQIDPMVEYRALEALIQHTRSQPQIVDNEWPAWSYRYDQLKFEYIRAIKTASPQRFNMQVR